MLSLTVTTTDEQLTTFRASPSASILQSCTHGKQSAYHHLSRLQIL